MIEKASFPIVIFDAERVLPGGTAFLESQDSEVKKALEVSEKDYTNGIVLFFAKDGMQDINNVDTVGIFGIVTSKEEHYDESGKVNFEVLLESRATLVDKIIEKDGYYFAEVNIYHDILTTIAQRKLFESIREKVLSNGQYFLDNFSLIDGMLGIISNSLAPDIICDAIAANLTTVNIDKASFLNELDFNNRLVTLNDAVETASAQLNLDKSIENKVQKELTKEQREYYLRKKMRIIQEDLGDVDKASTDADKLKEQIKASKMPEEIKEKMLKEVRRYQNTPSASPDSVMIRSYLELMLELPWDNETIDNLDITQAREKLDETHFGLEKVKERILEYLSVKLYTGKNPQTILCLAGAPGVGKTTLAHSIANALGRKFVKQSMGGVKDEAEIRGHRRTYIGALPGRIINGIKEAGVNNPVFLLDEIDKIGSDYKGDPSAALLEVLDPAQNVHFMDHYTEVEFDLSKVMFICTANYLENVPAPLRDRMEIIELSSYTELEKFQIGKNYVVKTSLEKNGLEKEKFEITDEAIEYLIKYYTREAGARQLERCMDSLVRKAIKEILENKVEKIVVTEQKITEMLGKKLYDYSESTKEDLVGCVNGLAWTAAGGDTLQIEVQLTKGKGNLHLTGKLGDVMKESAEVAYTLVKANTIKYNIDSKKFDEYDVHIHVPEGATPKDGPSAGVTLSTAIMSAFTGRLVRHDVAMTGEITLTGRVLPIGGLKEKSIAAYRAGLKKILIPQENNKDLEDIPQEVKDHVEIVLVSKVYDVFDNALI